MARGAVVRDVDVAKCNVRSKGGKDGGAVTDRTILGGRQMIHMLSYAGPAIVTRRTIIDNTCMIELSGGKSTRDMANAAILTYWNWYMGIRQTGRNIIVVARIAPRFASFYYRGVVVVTDQIEYESSDVMARPAIGGGDRMCSSTIYIIFTRYGCASINMAGAAQVINREASMINKSGDEAGYGMTV